MKWERVRESGGDGKVIYHGKCRIEGILTLTSHFERR